MKKIVLFILFFSLIFLPAFSQTNKKLWFGIELGTGLTLKDTGKKYDTSASGAHLMTSLDAAVGYYLNPQLSIGMKIGFTTYNRIDLSEIPLSLDVRYHPLATNPKLVLIGNAGYSLATSENNLKAEFMSGIGVGYKLFSIGKVDFTPSIRYDFCTYYMDYVNTLFQNQAVNSTFNKHTLCLKLCAAF